MKFISEGNVNVTVEINDDSTLDEVLEAFASYLKAVGYVIDHDLRLDFVNDYVNDVVVDGGEDEVYTIDLGDMSDYYDT